MSTEFSSAAVIPAEAATPTVPSPGDGVAASHSKRPSMVGNINGRHWLPEHDAALKLHLAAGLSHSQTAAAINGEFKTSYSRNACIGRANRIGLGSRCLPRGGKHTLKQKPDRPFNPKPQFQCDQSTGMRTVDVQPLHLSFADLETGQCLYPYGDGPFTFCGHAIIGDGSYCDLHDALTKNDREYRERPDRVHHMRKLATSTRARIGRAILDEEGA